MIDDFETAQNAIQIRMSSPHGRRLAAKTAKGIARAKAKKEVRDALAHFLTVHCSPGETLVQFQL